jgi:hypothetical protein
MKETSTTRTRTTITKIFYPKTINFKRTLFNFSREVKGC